MMKKILVLLALQWCCSNSFAQQSGFIQFNKQFISPDDRFNARYVNTLFPTTFDRHPTEPTECFSITDRSDGSTILVPIMCQVLSVNWTGDSRTIVTIENIAHGSICALYNHVDGKWNARAVYPPDDSSSNCAVVKQKIGFNEVRLTYKVFDKSNDASKAGFYLTEFVVDTAAAAVKKVVSRTKISAEAYDELRFLPENY